MENNENGGENNGRVLVVTSHHQLTMGQRIQCVGKECSLHFDTHKLGEAEVINFCKHYQVPVRQVGVPPKDMRQCRRCGTEQRK